MKPNRWSLLIALLFVTTALAAEPVRDPWSGFGLGSTVKLHQRVEIGGKVVQDEHKSCRVQRVSVDGSVAVGETAVIDGKEEKSTMFHVHGADPDEMLVLESEKQSKLTIAGKEYPVTVRRWVGAKNEKELEKLAKPFPQILEGTRSLHTNVEVSLTFYEAKSADVEIPYHEIETPGLDISVGPRVLKAEFRFRHLDDDGKADEEAIFTETVAGLSVPFKAKDQTANCVVLQIEMSQWSKGQDKPMLGKGEYWYSNAVPGRVVKQTQTGETPEGKVTGTLVVESFDVQPPLPKIDLAKLAADGKRPAIPGPEWRQLQVGAWRVHVAQIMERGARQPSHFEIGLLQVVQVLDKNRYVTLSKKLTDNGWEDNAYEIVDSAAPEDATKDAKTEREEFKLLEETVACERQTMVIEDRFGTATIVEWKPTDEKWKKTLAEAGLNYVRRTEDRVSKDAGGEQKHKEEEVVVALDSNTSAGGKALACVQVRKNSWEEEQLTHVKYSFHNQTAPGDSVGSIDVSKRDFFFHHLLDFGEADEAFPTVEKLREQYREAAKLLRTVDLNAVK